MTIEAPVVTGAKPRLTELDGLRALAIGAVLAFHCLNFPTAGHTLAGYAGRLPRGGWGGVNIFFVLSGFLIGGILIDGRGQPGQMRRFMIRRSVRIVPLYAVVLASFYVVPMLLATPADWLFGGAVPWWSHATLTQNFTTPIIGHDALYLAPTWSLAVEVQVYVLLGFALTRAPARAVLAMMVTGVGIAELCRIAFALSGHGIFGYFILPARIDAACLGVMVAMAARSDVALAWVRGRAAAIWAAVLALIAAVVLMGMAGQGVGSAGADIFTHLALGVASAAAIAVLIAAPDNIANRVLRTRPLVALGTISYGVYLLHVPVIGLTHATMGRADLAIDGWRGAMATIIGLAVTIGVAQLSWLCFEKPLIRWSHRISRARPATAPESATRLRQA